MTKAKGELSSAYEQLRTVDTEKAGITGKLKSLERDINEIDEKLKKDEGRKVKIQEELDNLAREKDAALAEGNKYED